MARKTNSTNTELLRQEFLRADMVLKDRIDGLIRQFDETNPQFVMSYKNARKITGAGVQGSGGTPPAPTTPRSSGRRCVHASLQRRPDN